MAYNPRREPLKATDSTHYPKAYGQWAGKPEGHAPDFDRCAEEVRASGRWPHYHQCTKPRGHGPGEAYCAIHDPVKVAARKAASEEAGKAKWNKQRKEWSGPRFYNVLKQIADGHNDARGLAAETLAEFHKGDH